MKKLLFLALFVFVAPAYAAGTGKPAHIMWPIINFSIYSTLITLLYFKKIKPALRVRKEKVIASIQSAGTELTQAEAELEAVESRLATLPAEKEDLVKKYAFEAEKMTEQVIQDAESQAKKIAEDVERLIENEFLNAKRSVQESLVSEAMERARKELTTSLNDKEDKTLREKALKQLVV